VGGLVCDAGVASTADAKPDAGPVVPPVIAGDWRESDVSTDVVDTLLKAGDFTGFLKCLAESELAETLKGGGPFTVLAPNDAAFAKLKKDFAKLLADKERLRRFVRYHVMPGRLSVADLKKLKNGDRLPTLLDKKAIKLGIRPDGIRLDRASVVRKDMQASNGLIQGLDTVLTP
jgi:uncharacterized surface protein with fasciclin (FAS1) repeats